MQARELPSIYTSEYIYLIDKHNVKRLFKRDEWVTKGANGDFAHLVEVIKPEQQEIEVYPLRISLSLSRITELGIKIFPKLSHYREGTIRFDDASLNNEVSMMNCYLGKKSSELVLLRSGVSCIFMPYYPSIDYRALPGLGDMAKVINFLYLYGGQLLALHSKNLCFTDIQENNCLVSLEVSKINVFQKKQNFLKKKKCVSFECRFKANLIDFGQAGSVGASLTGENKKIAEGKVAQAEHQQSFDHDSAQFLTLANDLIGTCLTGGGVEVLRKLETYNILKTYIENAKTIGEVLFALKSASSNVTYIETPDDLAKVIGGEVSFAQELISSIKKSDYIRKICEIAVNFGCFNASVLQQLIQRYTNYEFRLNAARIEGLGLVEYQNEPIILAQRTRKTLDELQQQTLAWCRQCLKSGKLADLFLEDFLALTEDSRASLLSKKEAFPSIAWERKSRIPSKEDLNQGTIEEERGDDTSTDCCMSDHGKQSWGIFSSESGNEQSNIDSEYKR